MHLIERIALVTADLPNPEAWRAIRHQLTLVRTDKCDRCRMQREVWARRVALRRARRLRSEPVWAISR